MTNKNFTMFEAKIYWNKIWQVIICKKINVWYTLKVILKLVGIYSWHLFCFWLVLNRLMILHFKHKTLHWLIVLLIGLLMAYFLLILSLFLILCFIMKILKKLILEKILHYSILKDGLSLILFAVYLLMLLLKFHNLMVSLE